MPRRDFNAALGEAAKDLGAGMSDDAARRVRARLEGGPGRRRRRVRWGRVGGVGAVVALAIVAAVSLRAERLTTLGGFEVAQASADLAATASASRVTISAGHCTLRDEALGSELQVEGPARLARLADGVEVASGTVELDVDHGRARPAPFRVRVSHGTIEVLGTRFTVTQREEGGEVTLHRGSIQFRADDGRVRLLSPGESLSWPLPPEAKPEPPAPPPPLPVEPLPAKPTVTAPPKPPSTPVEAQKPFDAEALLDRIAVLRSRGQYAEAVTALDEALREHHAPATDERLSFELGAILTRQLHDAPRACAHWRAHRERFPKGRYETEIAQARSELHCAD